MKIYKTQEERAEAIEWLRSDSRMNLAKKNAISYAQIAHMANNPDMEVGLTMVGRVRKAITEWKRQKWHETHDAKPVAAPAETEPAPAQERPGKKALRIILLDMIHEELEQKTDEQLVGIYKAVLKA